MAIEYQIESDEVLDHIKQVINNLGNVKLFGNSVHDDEGDWLFMIKEGAEKFLVVVPEHEENSKGKFHGDITKIGSVSALKCELTHENAEKLRSRFDFANAKPIEKEASIGFDNWFGVAGSAHLRIAENYDLEPVLAQQSIRELNKINFSAEEVLDAATWTVFQNGFHENFGANADHIRSTEEIDKMAALGYTLFSIELSDSLNNEVNSMADAELETAFQELPWIALEDRPEAFIERVLESETTLESGFQIKMERRDVLEAMVKNGNAIAEAKRISNYISQKYSGHPAELEISVCEAVNPMTVFEHFLISSELHRLGVDITAFAPCFHEDVNQLTEELQHHLNVAGLFGQYKISIYMNENIGDFMNSLPDTDSGSIHIKTSGSSYIAALKTVARVEPQLFDEIFRRSASHGNGELSSENPEKLMDKSETRKMLLQTAHAILSGSDSDDFQFRNRITQVLKKNEELYVENLVRILN